MDETDGLCGKFRPNSTGANPLWTGVRGFPQARGEPVESCLLGRLGLGRFGLGHVYLDELCRLDRGCERRQEAANAIRDDAEIRVAQHVAGRGVATATVRELCRLAAARHGLHTLRAATSSANVASQKVLTKAGFVPVGPADPAHLGGKPGTWYQRDLAAGDAHPVAR